MRHKSFSIGFFRVKGQSLFQEQVGGKSGQRQNAQLSPHRYRQGRHRARIPLLKDDAFSGKTGRTWIRKPPKPPSCSNDSREATVGKRKSCSRRKKNELLTPSASRHVDGTTIQGCYWIPALLSEEIPEPDGPPVRVRLLGERSSSLFRDTQGRIGLLDEHLCPIAGTSLFFSAATEDCGLRCIYPRLEITTIEGNGPRNARGAYRQPVKKQSSSYGVTLYRGRRVGINFHGSQEEKPVFPTYAGRRVRSSKFYIAQESLECKLSSSFGRRRRSSHLNTCIKVFKPDGAA